MCWQAKQCYPAEPASPRRARQFCAEQVTTSLGAGAQPAQVRDTAMMLVSELMTNAVNAGARCATLRIDFHRDRMRVSVTDDAEGYPRVLRVGPRDEHGRGLAIVASVADRWGVDDVADGKRVWAEFGLPAGLPTRFECALASR